MPLGKQSFTYTDQQNSPETTEEKWYVAILIDSVFSLPRKILQGPEGGDVKTVRNSSCPKPYEDKRKQHRSQLRLYREERQLKTSSADT